MLQWANNFTKIITLLVIALLDYTVEADNYILEEPSSCEVCKYFATELLNRLSESEKSKEILRTGHGLDTRNRKEFKYKTSELRLVEATDGICDKILQYNMHKERTGSLRFAKGRSQTMETLHGLVNKGVKVELGIPYDLWDEPSVEVTIMKKQCERILEKFEETIEDWYFHKQEETSLIKHLCQNAVLRNKNQSCLEEKWTGKETKYHDDDEEEEVKSSRKKKPKNRKSSKKKPSRPKGDSDSDDSGDEATAKDEL